VKKDILFPLVENVHVAIALIDGQWQALLINRKADPLTQVMVTSRGYGEKEDKKQETSLLRHSIGTVDASAIAHIEPLDPGVFHLTNEYWVSFYIGHQVFDKKYIFFPESINDKNLCYIKELKQKGILHS